MNNGAFGENFPYSNFHDLNMDWIIEVVKEFKDEYPDIVDELNKKLNKPVFNPDGSANYVLMYDGNDSTKWATIGEVTEPEITSAVYEWLDEHPEATTTVEDNSISIAKLNSNLKYRVLKNNSGCISPIYIGDYITSSDFLPSSVVRVGDNFICVNAPTREYATAQSSGNGYIYNYSLIENAKTEELFRLIGHGNSIAYDGTYYYIVPIWEYANNTETRNNKVYVFTNIFTLLKTLEAPAPGNAISFDHVTSKLYYFGDDNGIYVIENDTFTLYSRITNMDAIQENIIHDRSYIQDFAIHNNEFYMSSPFGNILHGLLTENESEISDSFYINNIDNTGRFLLGELEGMEFNEDGHLYAIIYTNMTTQMRDAFVVELPVNIKPQTSTVLNGYFNASDATLTLSDETINKFYLATYEIRSVNQLHVRLNRNSNQITIPENSDITEPYTIRIFEPLVLTIHGHYTCNEIEVFTPTLNIYTTNNNNQLTITKSGIGLIHVTRTGELAFTGSVALNLSTPNMTDDVTANLIDVGYTRRLTSIRVPIHSIENKQLRIGGGKLGIGNSLYAGSEDLIHLNKPFTFSDLFGFITSGTTEVILNMQLPKPTNEVTISGRITIRTVLGYLNGQNTQIDLTNTTNYNITVTRANDYSYAIHIKNIDGSAFSNATNNTPVHASGSIVIN